MFALCTDPDCDWQDEPTQLTWVKYTAHHINGGWICDGCIESWQDEQQFVCANAADMAEAGLNTGYVFLR